MDTGYRLGNLLERLIAVDCILELSVGLLWFWVPILSQCKLWKYGNNGACLVVFSGSSVCDLNDVSAQLTPYRKHAYRSVFSMENCSLDIMTKPCEHSEMEMPSNDYKLTRYTWILFSRRKVKLLKRREVKSDYKSWSSSGLHDQYDEGSMGTAGRKLLDMAQMPSSRWGYYLALHSRSSFRLTISAQTACFVYSYHPYYWPIWPSILKNSDGI